MAGGAVDYLINIATKMQGGDSAAASLATLGDRLLGAGSSASQLDDVLKQSSAAIEEAAAASKVAADAVAAGEAAYKQNEVAADRAAKTAERYAQQIEAQRAKLQKAMDAGDDKGAARSANKLQDLTDKYGAATAKAESMASALKGEGAALDASRAKADAAAAAHQNLVKADANLASAAKHAADEEKKLAAAAASAAQKAAHAQAAAADKAASAAHGTRDIGQLGSALRQLPGPLGKVGGGVLDLADNAGGLMKTLGPMAGLALGVVTAVVALAAAFVAAAAAALKFAITQADAARNSKIATEVLSGASPALAHLADAMEVARQRTGVAESELLDLAKGLEKAKIKAEDLPDALKGLALAKAAGADTQAWVQELTDKLKAGTISAAEFAKTMEQRLGGAVSKKMKSLDSLSERFGENIRKLFEGVNTEGLLTGLERLVNLFDSSSASGKALKFLIEKIFAPLEGADDVFVMIERGFILALIGALKVYIAMRKLNRVINEFLGGSGSEPPLFNVLKAGQATVMVAKLAFADLMEVANSLIAVVVAPFVAMGAAAGALWDLLGEVWDGITGGASDAASSLSSFDLSAIGGDMIQGLADGITGGASAVLDAMTGAVQSAIDSAKSLLDISSPSKVFAKIGGYTAEGFAEGVDDGAGLAQASMRDMVDPSQAQQSSGGAPGAGGGPTGGVTITGPITFNVATADQAIETFNAWLTRAREGDADVLEGGAHG